MTGIGHAWYRLAARPHFARLAPLGEVRKGAADPCGIQALLDVSNRPLTTNTETMGANF